jgi:hypothetical protein
MQFLSFHTVVMQPHPQKASIYEQGGLRVTSIDTKQNDFSEMDNAGISKEHWKNVPMLGS